MPPSTRFDAHVLEARVIATRLSSHDPDYENGLATGAIGGALHGSVRFAVGALEMAYCDLADELAMRCRFPVGSVHYRFPVYPVLPTGQPIGSSELMDSLRNTNAGLAAKVRSHLEVTTADGWLGTLVRLAGSPEQMNLRRAVATVSLSKGIDGTIEMNLRSETGESVPMLAPVLLQEGEPTSARIGYYLAILPEAREAVSFLDRCVRGMSTLGDKLRAELINFGY
jgi:hypothetical protein